MPCGKIGSSVVSRRPKSHKTRTKKKSNRKLTEASKLYLVLIERKVPEDEMDLAAEVDRYPGQVRSTVNALVKRGFLKITGTRFISGAGVGGHVRKFEITKKGRAKVKEIRKELFHSRY